MIPLFGDTLDPVMLIRPEDTVPVTMLPVAENALPAMVAVMELVAVVDVADDEELELRVQPVMHTPNNSAIESRFLIKWFFR